MCIDLTIRVLIRDPTIIFYTAHVPGLVILLLNATFVKTMRWDFLKF